MIIYNKLANILKEREMKWNDLLASGISANTPQKFTKNRPVTTETIDKICSFLKVQPGEIMEWVESEEDLKKIEIQRQIESLQAQQKKLEEQLKTI